MLWGEKEKNTTLRDAISARYGLRERAHNGGGQQGTQNYLVIIRRIKNFSRFLDSTRRKKREPGELPFDNDEA